MSHSNRIYIKVASKRLKTAFLFAVMIFTGMRYNYAVADYNVAESNANTLKVVISTGFSGIENIRPANSDNEMILPHFQDAIADESTQNVGAPQMYFAGADFVVDGENTFSLESWRILESKKIFGEPAPMPIVTRDGTGIYTRDEAKYATFLKPETVTLRYKGISAGLPIAGVSVSAFNYDYATKEITIIEKIEVTIKFDTPLKLHTGVKATHRNALVKCMNPEFANAEMSLANRSELKRKTATDHLQASTAKWAKIPVSETGAYTISGETLKSLGADIGSEGAKNIRIYGVGGKVLDGTPSKTQYAEMPEQQIYRVFGSNGELSQIVFFAENIKGVYRNAYGITRFINPYSEKSYYLLSFGGEDTSDTLPATQSGFDGEIVNRPNTYRHYIYEEDDDENPFPAPSGLQWFGKPSFPVSYTHKLYNLDRDSAVSYSFSLAHKLNYGGSTTYGKFYISENGNNIYTQQIAAHATSYDASRKTFGFTAPASNIAVDDRSIIKIEYKVNGSAYGVPYLDYYMIGYERSTTAIDNEIDIISPKYLTGGTEYTVTGFTGSEIYGWDITKSASPEILKNYSTTGSIFVLRADPTDSVNNHFYISSKLRRALPEIITFPNLHAETEIPDILVITHKDLKQSAEKYAEYRNTQGIYTAKIYSTEDIYNEFGCGMPDPTAIRNFITYKYHFADSVAGGKRPQFVLLWGDAHDDYRNLTTKVTNFVPTFESSDADFEMFNETNSFCTDDYFGLTDGDDYLLDLAVGRLPVRANSDGDVMLNKIRIYENSADNGTWRSRFTFIADDCNLSNGNTETLNHVPQSESVAEIDNLDYFDKKKIYLVNYPVVITSDGRRKPKVTEDLLSTANVSGTLFLNFIGHGNPRVWTHEEILERDITIPKFTNLNKLFFCYAATCDYGRFDNAEVSSGAEDFVRLAAGGAIGIMTATRTVLISNNGAFSKVFFSELFDRNADGSLKTMGQIAATTKNSSNSGYYNGKQLVTNDAKYCLLMDPSITLLQPKEDIRITKINNEILNDTDNVNIEGLSEVEIEAKVCIPETDSLDENFNGVAVMTLYDAAETVSVPEYSYTNVIRQQGETLARSSATVTNGIIKGSFFVSKDISFSDNTAKLVLYAYSNDETKSALGGTQNIKVKSINGNAAGEDNSPVVNLYLDSRNFHSGQSVSAEPLLIIDLSDDTGINTSGTGIGRKIEMWLDDDEPVDLTPLYVNSFTDPRSGSIENRLYSLSEGEHTIKIRAWDLFDNYTVANTAFHIGGGSSKLQISKTMFYPNPMTTQTGTFAIYHTGTELYNVEIEIYNIYGNRIKKIKTSASELNKVNVLFDGFDDYGNSIPQGVYIYYVKLANSTATGKSHGKFVKIE